VWVEDVSDLDWYIDHVVVPSDIEKRPVGPVLAWQGSWRARAHRLRRDADDSPVGSATRLALGQGFVMTREQARCCGVSDATIRRLVRRGAWTSCGYGSIAIMPTVALGGDTYDEARRMHAIGTAAAVGKRREHLAACGSAAVLHGLPVLKLPPVPELVASTPNTVGRLDAARVRSAALRPHDIDSWFGVPLTTPARTIVDLTRFDARSGLMAADAALHEGLLRLGHIAAAIGGSVGLPGIRRARDVLRLASPLIESPFESLVHLALRDDGFPPPNLQFHIVGADGKRYRVDFAWPQFRVVLEADGRGKYRGDELWGEKQRELALTRAGYRVVRVVWKDVLETWPTTSAWLSDLLPTDRSR
jgi:hypothetical protein